MGFVNHSLEFSQEEIERAKKFMAETPDLKKTFSLNFILWFMREWDKVSEVYKEYYKR